MEPPSTAPIDLESPAGPPSGFLPPPWSAPVRKKPAAIYLAIVASFATAGFILEAVTSSPAPAPPAASASTHDGLTAVPAASVIRRIASGGEPPSDVVRALVVPSKATVTKTAAPSRGVDVYDASVTMAVPAKVSAVISFYKTELQQAHWKIGGEDATADGKGTEVFATIPSSDGYYWEVGIVADPVTPSIDPELAGSDATSTSSVVLRIFEVEDES